MVAVRVAFSEPNFASAVSPQVSPRGMDALCCDPTFERVSALRLLNPLALGSERQTREKKQERSAPREHQDSPCQVLAVPQKWRSVNRMQAMQRREIPDRHSRPSGFSGTNEPRARALSDDVAEALRRWKRLLGRRISSGAAGIHGLGGHHDRPIPGCQPFSQLEPICAMSPHSPSAGCARRLVPACISSTSIGPNSSGVRFR